MSDIIGKVIDAGTAVEGKVRDFIRELEGSGSSKDDGPLGAVKNIENKVVEEGVKAVKELLGILEECKSKVGGEASGVVDSVAGRLNLASASELEVVKEMARVAREKVDSLEKRLSKLEGN